MAGLYGAIPLYYDQDLAAGITRGCGREEQELERCDTVYVTAGSSPHVGARAS